MDLSRRRDRIDRLATERVLLGGRSNRCELCLVGWSVLGLFTDAMLAGSLSFQASP